jgi:hypothetical protein
VLILLSVSRNAGVRAADSRAHWVRAFGAAVHGGEPSPHPREAVDLETRRDGTGYWVTAADGSVFGFGNAPYFGSMGGSRLRDSIVDLAATPTADGYWLAGADGSVFGFGRAGYFGSMGGRGLLHPITSMAVTPSGRGYLLLAVDGSVFGFGDAPYLGSLGGRPINSPVVDLELTPSARGYWLLTADGSVFGFGDAAYVGSGYGSSPSPATDLAATPNGRGYWLLRLDGSLTSFGEAVAHGEPHGSLPAEAAAVALAPTPAGDGYLVLSTPGALRLSTAGDIHGEGRVRDLLNRGGNPLAHVAAELRNDDLSIVNLETPVGSPGRPEVKTYVFLAPESLLPALESGGADVVSVANNHGMDHGAGALLRTIDLSRKHGLAPVGGGADRSSAYRASLHRARGRTVAVVGVTRVLSAGWDARPGRAGVASAYDEAAVVDAVRAAEHVADVVVVAVHWGIERDRCPDPHQRRLTRLMVDAGTDVIAGHHPHVLQGLDPGPRAAVAYSLGNFVWYHSSPPSNVSAILRTEHPPGGGVRAEMLPAEIDGSGSPRLLTGARAVAVKREVASLQPGHGRC